MEQAVTVGKILSWLNQWAPFAAAEDWDNVGLLIGNGDMPVEKVLTSLDVTPAVIRQAAAIGVNLIVSHHPVIFRPLTKLSSEDSPYLLARHGIAAIGVHTNLDKANGGVNDILAGALGLQEVYPSEDGLCRIGTLSETMNPAEFAAWVSNSLQVPTGGIQWIQGSRTIRTVGVCSGAGGDYLPSLLTKTDAFVTGELHYHEWPLSLDTTVVAAGHFYTEIMIAKVLAKRLKEEFPTLNVVSAEESCPYQHLIL